MAFTLDRPQQLALVASAAAAIVSIATYSIFEANEIAPAHSRKIIPSPRKTLIPELSKDQSSRLAYPPDLLPGARDVDTPYGSIRVYEWGPEIGRKVLFVHGDATPCPMFTPIANDLVAKGCRVMLFDLWGRGYTDTPDGLQHDCRLYTLQILYALTSSPIAWTGDAAGPFSLIGFSMGGPICLDFFAHHSKLVESMVLLGPAGLLRGLPNEYTRFWFRYPSLVSKATMRGLLGTLLSVDMSNSAAETRLPEDGFTPANAVQFQFDYHSGHLQSLLSNIQYGPIQHQEAIWESAGNIIRGTDTRYNAKASRLSGGKILVVCGADDTVVVPEDVHADLTKYMGEGHFDFNTVPGGHGFPWGEGHSIANFIIEFWGL